MPHQVLTVFNRREKFWPNGPRLHFTNGVFKANMEPFSFLVMKKPGCYIAYEHTNVLQLNQATSHVTLELYVHTLFKGSADSLNKVKVLVWFQRMRAWTECRRSLRMVADTNTITCPSVKIHFSLSLQYNDVLIIKHCHNNFVSCLSSSHESRWSFSEVPSKGPTMYSKNYRCHLKPIIGFSGLSLG